MSGLLPNWLARMFGIEPGPSERAAWSLDYAWRWPPWATLLFAAAVAALVIFVYLREARQVSRRYRLALAVIRLAIIAAVVLMIAQLTLTLKRTALPTLAIVLDDSQSMTIADDYSAPRRQQFEERMKPLNLPGEPLSRWNLARGLLLAEDGKMLREAAERYRVRVYGLTSAAALEADSLTATMAALGEHQPSGTTTRLGAGVRAVLQSSGDGTSAALLLTDGINTDGPPLADAAAYAAAAGVPLICVGVGSSEPARDVKLSDLLVDDVVFVDDAVSFQAELSGVGFEGRRVSVVLKEQGKPDILADTETTIGPDGQPQTIRLTIHPREAGDFRYVMEVQPQPEETPIDNNRCEARIQVRKEKLRVLLADGSPRYEYRFLQSLLARSDAVQVDRYLQDADVSPSAAHEGQLRIFPGRREDLFAYDAVIFGDLDPAQLGGEVMQLLANFVDQPQKGGAIIFVAGPKHMPDGFRDTPLARLLPFDPAGVAKPDARREETFVVFPTDLGWAWPPMQLGDSPAETREIWQQVSPLDWRLELPRLKPAARVLADAAAAQTQSGARPPLIIMQYVGAGKVLFHATDETYRWRWRVGDTYFGRYWIQALRWLCRAKLRRLGGVALSTDSPRYDRGQSVLIRVAFADDRAAPPEDDGVTVVVDRKGQPSQRVGLRRMAQSRGMFEGMFSPQASGQFHAWLAVPAMDGSPASASFDVKSPAGELDRAPIDMATLRQAAHETNGRFYMVEEAGRLLDDLPPGTQTPIEVLPPWPLWNYWPSVALVLLLLVAEWVLRKLGGMV